MSTTRIILSLGVAITADALQFCLVSFGWVFVDQAIDVVAMALTVWIIGFHILLLPTFLVEFIPAVGMLPTWTGCVAAVIALKKKNERASPPVIDV